MATKKSFKEDYMLSCPICKKKLWASKINAHRSGRHSDLSPKDFEKKIIEAINSGEIKPKHFEASSSSIGLESGTQKLAKAKPKLKYGIGKITQGGKVSPK
ncbi:MAG: hypothetical protein VB954_14635 [Thalassolituus sp.]|uniref:hypothetical protein n=1 Tax=Thalassolituus sp. TaxID=2030822 RepID=UPI003982625A